ncbi:hypothetical protein RF11_15943 [Thelohanellus kitauei]|uniref:HTH OST-type domain-containing protein n=1 Tax=Thelohanellus kitauei TaxID=669202 RepID=A0A0C2IM36_THEKT|nr:hypothetical protein RF11_15943 [Thelohanellus kitauei]
MKQPQQTICIGGSRTLNFVDESFLLLLKMEVIKNEIRSVLVSCRVPLSIKELIQQYKHLTGKALQCRELGYNDIECLIMDIPDVIDTVWSNGELKLICKRDKSDVAVEALINVLKHSKKSRTGHHISSNRSLQLDLFINRQWQDYVCRILEEKGKISIDKLSEELGALKIENPEKRLTLAGALKRSWNFQVDSENSTVELKFDHDILLKIILKILDLHPEGIRLEEFRPIIDDYLKRPFKLEMFGFTTFHSLFLYYSNHVTISVSKNGFFTIFSKKCKV